MREMEQELELHDDSVVAKTHKIHNKTVIIGMIDVRTLEFSKGGKCDSMVASGVHREGLDLKDLLELQQ